MITIVGIGHVFDISQQVREVILEKRPDVVCVELDPARYQALLQKERGGSVPLTYRILAKIQERIANEYGVDVGNEMLSAINAAGEVGAGVAFIDVNAQEFYCVGS